MEDAQIVFLLENRKKSALYELNNKYGHYCSKIAWNILENHEDVEECVNDTWLSVWNVIPPQKPKVLSVFCGTIIKRLALDRIKRKYAGKRVDGHITEISSETAELSRLIINQVEDIIVEKEILREINLFLQKQDREKQEIFIRRYWYLDSIEEIAVRHKKSANSIKVILHRMRKNLWNVLKEGGYVA